MKRILSVAILATLTASAEDEVRSGHATAQWLVVDEPKAPTPPDVPQCINTVVRLKVDEPWHVYWYNPGEAGMPTTVKLNLPEGWRATSLMHPVPKRFKTGGLLGFGHEGTVDYRIALSVPKNFKGNAVLEAEVSWLTCNDDACVPGDVVLKLMVEDGKVVGPMMDREEHRLHSPNYPATVTLFQAEDGVEMSLKDGGDFWELMIERPEKMGLDPDKAEVFFETAELVTADSDAKFKKLGERWVGSFPKNEYAPEKPEVCSIVLVQKGKHAMRLHWEADGEK